MSALRTLALGAALALVVACNAVLGNHEATLAPSAEPSAVARDASVDGPRTAVGSASMIAEPAGGAAAHSSGAHAARSCDQLDCGEMAECEQPEDAAADASCRCKAGFEDRGAGCRDQDECAADNGGCDSHASCINLPGSRACECRAGFRPEGETACIDLCSEAGCDAHARCGIVAGQPVCQCQSPYTGDGQHCVFSDTCSTIGCDDNASCLDDPARCVCNLGFEGDGKTCAAIDECKSGPCKNGGRCIDAVGDFSCDCSGSGFRGPTCEEAIDDCSPNPCEHGTCTDQLNAYSCQCAPGYTGERCEINRDDCASAPCVRGTCSDLVDDYLCNCPAGYAGKHCESNTDDCGSQPCARGTCVDAVDGFTCTCPAGYDGTTCDHNIDDCAQKPCVRGTCSDGVDSFSCACPAGYDGATCDHNIDDCAKNPCARGSCSDLVNDYKCTCPAGWRGKRCETADCASAKCPASAPCRIANSVAICYPSACTEAGLCIAENSNGSGAARVVAGRNADWSELSWANRARYFAYIAEVHGGHACVFPQTNEKGTPLVIPLGEVRSRSAAYGASNSWPSDACKK